MILFKKTDDLTNWLKKQSATGKSIGFVPTMGALHEGHISLITISKETAGVTVCSIFVNPTQFNDPKDFQKYPITLEKDIALLEQAGVDVLFLPEVAELYPGGTKALEVYDLGRVETILEGKYRPGHFQGVCQVMYRLLNMVRPDDLFMGQKDYQQCMVVQRLLELSHMTSRLHRCPIVREKDGLAMSSRNTRLTPEQRTKATAIYKALLLLKEEWPASGAAAIPKAEQLLKQADFQIDYVEVADAATLEPITDRQSGAAAEAAARPADVPPSGSTARVVALIAAFQGEVRLIDNMVL
jgi:pantoate--beta-alanine ligase